MLHDDSASRCTYEGVLSVVVHTNNVGIFDKNTHGVATISRLLQIIGLFCKRALYKRRYSTKETYNFEEPTNRSHPIRTYIRTNMEAYKQVQGGEDS